ncbi:metallophosphatase domain-containing protein [Myxococcus landrumensis]|uniref:Metallophosphatase domain-containing protein n=1 Tax=Myxococcus landrumensis TaxID=2813577 RepID=A0ABX7MZT9_9BACT|nr:metallophosphatase domain-containing protein [Myxococcus landrumus]QSQ11972.1 metallophosphatase domain-containing protein [Myxococcus landrumus]
MRLVLISDTHRRHEELEVPACDVLIHAGDFSKRGKQPELESFLSWFSAQPAREKVFVAGNHDFICEREPGLTRELARQAGVHYLDDEELVVSGLRLWGSPVTPRFGGMAFNYDRGAPILARWNLIPEGLDILITHGPPKGVGDRTFLGAHVGCSDLLARVHQVRPRLHVFGHIHESFGEHSVPDVPTRFLNVANCHLLPFGLRPPVTVELEPQAVMDRTSTP